YNIGSLRHRIGIVTQEPVLFATSIYQNIVWGAIDPESNPPSKEDVIEACKAANAHQFINMLPNKYETLVGEGGALLSGGQKQRIAIARAAIRNPDILLLDEATSALDTASERLVQDALDKLSADRTTISIAHRLSTIRNCDQIYVVHDGIISENGTHDELVMAKGEYAAMVKAQELRQAVRANVDVEEAEAEEDVDGLIANELKEQALDLKATTHQTLQSIKRVSITQSQRKSKKHHKSLEESSDLFLLLRLLYQYRGSMKIAIPGTVLAIINGAVMPCFALVYARLLTALGNPDLHEMKRESTKYACLFMIFAVVDLFGMFGRAGLFHVAGESLTKRIRHETFKAYLSFESSFFDDEKNGTGALTSRLATDTEDVNHFVGMVMSTFVTAETIRNIKTVATLRREET
ncbi:hypothetical protein FBU59_005632, partial [Linderina macrospora]